MQRVLVVDDDPDLRFLLRVALDRRGESVVIAEASNGREAIDAARAHQPDVIILDEMMPVMTGMEALPELRSAAPNSRIVVYSAAASTEVGRRFADADGFLAKGGPLADLVDMIGG